MRIYYRRKARRSKSFRPYRVTVTWAGGRATLKGRNARQVARLLRQSDREGTDLPYWHIPALWGQ